MPRAEPEERLRKLKEKEARIKAERQRAEARQREAERKRELRRKILTGGMLLDKIARGEEDAAVVKAQLDCFLHRPQDRALFDLPPHRRPLGPRVLELHRSGVGLRRIAAILEEEGGHVPPGHYKRWHRKSVSQLLRQLERANTPPAP